MLLYIIALIWSGYLCMLASSAAILKSENMIKSNEKEGQNVEHRMPTELPEQTGTCSNALRQCKHRRLCFKAMHNLKMRCKSKSGQCDARMHDLPKCGQIMDTLNKHFNPEEKCSCGEKNPSHCALIQDTIYNNPCFASVRYLRKKNMMPLPKDNSSSKNSTAAYDDLSRDLVEELLNLGEKEDAASVAPANSMSPSSEEANDNPGSLHDNVDLNKSSPNVLQIPDVKLHPTSVSQKTSLEMEDKDKAKKNIGSSNTLILHVILVVAGLFLLAVLVLIGGLLLYCRLWRNGKKTRTAISKS